jgi:hypothetical protein
VLILEEQLKKLKSEMSKDELSGFEFSDRMKRKVIGRFEEKPRVSRFRGLMPAGLSAAFLVVFSVGIYWLVEQYYTEKPADTPPVVEEETPVVDEDADVPEFDEAMATALLDRYEDTANMVFADADDQPDSRLDSYSSLEEIYAFFNDFMEPDMIEKIFAQIISEQEDGLYLSLKDGIPVYSKSYDFTLEKISETEYKFIQYKEFDNDATDEKFTAVFKYNSGAWKIDSIDRIQKFSDKSAVLFLNLYRDTLSEYHKSQEDLYQELRFFMSEESINKLNLSLGENDVGVYVQGTDSIIGFSDGTPYDFKEVSEEEFRLTQIQESDLRGKEKFTAVFKVIDGTWKIASLSTEQIDVAGFDEKQAVELLERYNSVRDAAFQDALDQPEYKFRTYKTKEEFYQLFLGFMSRGHVEGHFSIRLDEQKDGMYMIPMDEVRTFWPKNPYKLGKISEHEYQLTQVQESDMHGREVLIVTFKNHSGTRKIDSIHSEDDSSTPWLSESGAGNLLSGYHRTQQKVFEDAKGEPGNKFKNYKSVEEINSEFAEIATSEFLKNHLDGMVAEKPDGAYLVTEEEPARYSFDLRHDLVRINDTEYKMTQALENNIYYTAMFTLHDGKWLINQITITELN